MCVVCASNNFWVNPAEDYALDSMSVICDPIHCFDFYLFSIKKINKIHILFRAQMIHDKLHMCSNDAIDSLKSIDVLLYISQFYKRSHPLHFCEWGEIIITAYCLDYSTLYNSTLYAAAVYYFTHMCPPFSISSSAAVANTRTGKKNNNYISTIFQCISCGSPPLVQSKEQEKSLPTPRELM